MVFLYSVFLIKRPSAQSAVLYRQVSLISLWWTERGHMNVRDRPDTDEMRENELLAALPSEDFERLLPSLERVVLPPFEILYDFDDEITHVYCPNRNTVISTSAKRTNR